MDGSEIDIFSKSSEDNQLSVEDNIEREQEGHLNKLDLK